MENPKTSPTENNSLPLQGFCRWCQTLWNNRVCLCHLKVLYQRVKCPRTVSYAQFTSHGWRFTSHKWRFTSHNWRFTSIPWSCRLLRTCKCINCSPSACSITAVKAWQHCSVESVMIHQLLLSLQEGDAAGLMNRSRQWTSWDRIHEEIESRRTGRDILSKWNYWEHHFKWTNVICGEKTDGQWCSKRGGHCQPALEGGRDSVRRERHNKRDGGTNWSPAKISI